jgi:hypothetical protein
MKRRAGHQLAAAIVAVVLALVVPRPVAGATADELIKEGVGLRRKGDDLGALHRFEQAYQMDKSPRALAQIGLAEQALGRWAASYEHLTQAREAKSDSWIGKNLSAINDAVNAVGEHVGRLEILGGSTGAEVRIDGAVRGTLPLPVPLTVVTGTITIDLAAPGFVPQQRTTVVRAQQTTRESFEPLAAVQSRERSPVAAPTVRADAIAPRPEPAAAAPSRSRATPTENATDQPSALRGGAKWIAWGLGAAALGLGTFGYLSQKNAGEKFDRDCRIDGAGGVVSINPDVVSVPICQDRKDDVDSGFRVEVIGFASAAVLAGTGLVLWLTEPESTARRTAAWSCVASLTPSGAPWMGCRLRF